MIDFRYHLVSIVAVFLALSIGIIIGATSLQGKVAGALEGQVSQLRDDKQELRSRLDAANEGSRRQDQYAQDVAPRALAGELEGRTVAVVSLPDTPSGLVRDTVAALRRADATVTSTSELSAEWVGNQDSDRDRAVRAAGREQGVDVEGVPEDRLGGVVLTEALTVEPGASEKTRTDRPGLDRLVAADLLDVDPARPERADSIVLLWSGEEKSRSGWVDLVTAAGLAGRPAVGVSAGPQDASNGKPDAMIATLRDSAEVTGTMSTVDHGETAVGQAAVVLALREEYANRAGHYGLDEDAAAVAPKLEERPPEPTP